MNATDLTVRRNDIAAQIDACRSNRRLAALVRQMLNVLREIEGAPACREYRATYTGYMRHKSANDKPCDPCMDAARTYWRDKSRRQTHGSTTLPPAACQICDAPIQRTSARGRPPAFCSEGCRSEKERRRARKRDGVPDVRHFECEACGKEWSRPPVRGQQPRWCSDACGNAVRRADRRAREQGAYVAPVFRRKIFERDGWLCGICGKKVDPRKRHGDPLAATIDHIVPLAAGGTHEPANVQCAHARCNSSKRDRAANDQLRLIG